MQSFWWGVVADPAHGFVLTLAAGGTLTELLQDRQSLLLPTSEASIRDALRRLKISRLLVGFRGGDAASISAIIDAVMQLQDYVTTHADKVVEIEINPLMCTKARAIVADALLVKGAS